MTREHGDSPMPVDHDDDTAPDAGPLAGSSLLDTVVVAPAVAVRVVEWGGASSAGRRRANEDAWGQRGDVYVVADGMGGRGGGAVAARTAVERLLARGSEAPARRDWAAIVRAVNAEVRAVGRVRGVERLGTTLVAAAVEGLVATVVHVGDSRAYRCRPVAPGERGARIDRLTSDHDVRTELLGAGLDVGGPGHGSPALRGITSFLGQDPRALRVDVLAVTLRAGERLLLCTDGVHRQLDDDRLRAAVAERTCGAAAARLVHDAADAGGRDNATALVVQVGAVDDGGAGG